MAVIKKKCDPILGRFGAGDTANYITLFILMVATLYPFYYVLVISTSTEKAFYADPYHLIPRSFTLDTYAYVLSNELIFSAFKISIVTTLGGLALSMLLSCMGAYVLSRRDLAGKKLMLFLIIITMFVNGGVTPWYIVVRTLHLSNTVLAYFIPTAISTFNLILLKNYFESLPDSLTESADVDGANDIVILFKIVLPVSLPILATVALFYAVFFWNDWFAAMMFSSDQKMYPLPLVLRNMIVSFQNFMTVGLNRQMPDMIKAAVIIVTITPIMLVYPFLQKYFIQGIMLGSVKE